MKGGRVLVDIETSLSTFLISSISRTIHITEENTSFVRNRLLEEKKGVVFCLWHNRMFYFPYYFASRFLWNGSPPFGVMISKSRDGERIAKVVEHLGGWVARGSTSRQGRQAVRKLIRGARRDHITVITPDGPRGPRYNVQKGVAFLAKATKQPLVPVTYGVSRYVQFQSWDRFVFPFPFNTGTVLFGDPIWPNRPARNTEVLRGLIQEKMNKLDNDLKELGYEYE